MYSPRSFRDAADNHWGETNLSLKNIKLLPNQYQGRERTFNTDNIFFGSGTEPTQVPRVTITGAYNHSFNAQGA